MVAYSSLPEVGRTNPYRTPNTTEQARIEAEERVLRKNFFDGRQKAPANMTTEEPSDDDLEAVVLTLPEEHRWSPIVGNLSAAQIGLHFYQGRVIYREPTHQFWVVRSNAKEWKHGRFLSDRDAHKAIDKVIVLEENLAIKRG
jgi:hypothetical protein